MPIEIIVFFVLVTVIAVSVGLWSLYQLTRKETRFIDDPSDRELVDSMLALNKHAKDDMRAFMEHVQDDS